MSVHRVLSVVMVALLLSAPAFAQGSNAALQGVVTDSQGGVLPGVAVVVTNTETGLAREAASNADGFFRTSALPPGPYAIAAKLDGFAPYSRTGLVLTVGQTATVDVKLTLGNVSEAVVVKGESPLVDTTSNSVGTTITHEQLDKLPLAGRDFQGLANLTPGVTGVGGGGINAGGQLNRNNSIVLDGTSNDEQGIASTRGSLSLESVQEYVVYTNQFSAEFGQASGAIVSVVSRAGTNNIDGRVFAFATSDVLDAQNPFSKAQGSGKAPYAQQRAGGFLGGPIVKDVWHYFGSYEGEWDQTTSVITSPLVPVDQREHAQDGNRAQYFGKTDYRLSKDNRLEGRYRRDSQVSKGLGIGGLNPYERGYDNTNRFNDGVVALTSVLSSKTVNEARVLVGNEYIYYSVDGYADPTGVSISRPDINQGKASNMPQGWDSWRVELADTLTHSFGKHDLKVGLDVQFDKQNTYFLGNKDGTFTFRTDAPFNAADPSTYPVQYTQTIGDWYDLRQNQMYGGFAQDTWRVRDDLTLNAGLRYDTETMFAKGKAVGVPQDLNNFAPRAGFNWTPTADRDFAIRGGFGIYYDQGFNNISGNISNSARSTSVTITNPGYPDPYAGGTIVPGKPSPTIAAPTIHTPYTSTLSIGLQRQIANGLVASADYVRAHGDDLFNAVDINAPINGVRPDANYLRVIQYQTTGRSWSNALLVSLARRTGRGPLFDISYTLSRDRRNVEDFGFTPQDSYNPGAELALAGNNRTHQVATSIVWPLPGGFQVSALIQARSGLPWNVTTGTDNNGDGNINDRPDLAVPGGDPISKSTYNSSFTGRVGNLGRNANTGPAFAQEDLRVSKFFRFSHYSVEGFAEAFNVTNHVNLGLPVGTLTASTFGKPTGLASGTTPRNVQFGFRFNF